MLDAKEFAADRFGPVEGEASRWRHKETGMLMVGRQGQSLAELLDEAKGAAVALTPSSAPPTKAGRKEALQAAIAAKRWAVETGGTVAMGVGVRTDEVGQAKLTGAIALFDHDPTLTTIDWEATPGVWVTLDGPTVRGLGVIVGRHIQSCFSHARQLSEAVTAADTHADLDAIDIEAGWP